MKRYPVSQSPLFKLSSPRRLAKVLGLEEQELEELANRSDNYKRFKVGKTKKRDVQEPKEKLRAVHKRISRWLARIETPDYLHSAIRGRSYITNAQTHLSDTNLIKVDIRAFFQNVKQHAVYLFFLNEMRCRGDVAMLLAKALTVDGHLPTGSPVSPILSYYAHKPMFDQIANLAAQRGLKFTVYVDDMCLSGSAATRATLFDVRALIAKAGLKSHKCRFFPAGTPRIVTGVALTKAGPTLPHNRHLRIKEGFDQAAMLPPGRTRKDALSALISRMHEAAQLDPAWKDRAKNLESKMRMREV
ncbi:reverse transcriptase family protein [uncultured Maritimibacter sp.]|uniref:reverse transcriptase family protein n=1 Tax=uncultured Maritimibacter sp. TaxID=991866 RepID=UPI002593AC3A|nr:reverse transcriptase family protein [uncultured Maritimibacter sp.]